MGGYFPVEPVEFQPTPPPAGQLSKLRPTRNGLGILLFFTILLFAVGVCGAILLGWVPLELLAALTFLTGGMIILGGVVLMLVQRIP